MAVESQSQKSFKKYQNKFGFRHFMSYLCIYEQESSTYVVYLSPVSVWIWRGLLCVYKIISFVTHLSPLPQVEGFLFSGSDKIGYELGLEPRDCRFEPCLPDITSCGRMVRHLLWEQDHEGSNPFN